MAGIELELTVTDRGSAEIASVARRAASAFDPIRSHAMIAGTAVTGIFRSAISHVGSFISSLTSVRGLLLLLSGAGGIALLSRAFQALGERSEPLSQRFGAIKEAIGGFVGRIIEYIGQNPALLRALDWLAWWVSDMTARLPEIEGTIRSIITWVIEFEQTTVPKLWGYLQQFIQWIKDAYQVASQLVGAAMNWLGGGAASAATEAAGNVAGGNSGGGEYSPETGMPLSEYTGRAAATVGGVTYNFTGAMSRSDVVSIINEANRESFRDGE